MIMTENKYINETLYHYEHDSGLKVYCLPKKGFKQYAIWGTKYGSIDNKFIVPGENEALEVPDGIAHFLEHKLFEEEDGNVFEKFAKFGASANAFTNFNMTAYLFSCTENFYESFEILLNYVQNPYFTDENVEKEKGIIEQEIKMYEDEAEWRVFFNFLQAAYVNHPVKKDIAGTVESIYKIDKELLYKCYKTFYHPSNMVLFVAGDINPEIIKNMVKDQIKTEKTQNEIKRFYPLEDENIVKSYTEQKLSVKLPLIYMGFKDTDIGYDGLKLYKKTLTTDILLRMIFGKSSLLYKELYDDSLITDSFSFEYTGECGYGYTIFGGESPNPDKLRKNVENILSGSVEINKPTFDRIKKIIFSRYVRQFNNVERISSYFLRNIVNNINIFDFIDVYNDISLKDVQDRFGSHFKNMVSSVILPRQS